MLPAAQVTVQQQQLHPTTMVLLVLRYPSREQPWPLQPAACAGQTQSPFSALLLG